jgi:hypothetical protein
MFAVVSKPWPDTAQTIIDPSIGRGLLRGRFSECHLNPARFPESKIASVPRPQRLQICDNG